MNRHKLTELFLFLSSLMCGLYAGMGWLMAMGINPAMKLMTDKTFIEFWQHIDYFMAARMRIFGPFLLLMVITTVVFSASQYRARFFVLLALALTIIIADIAFALNVNHSLNQYAQSIDLNNLPSDAGQLKWNTIDAFSIRIFLMIIPFLLVLSASWIYKQNT